MSKHSLFWKIIGLGLLLGLQAGAVLGLVTGLFFAPIGGLFAVGSGLGYGCAMGLACGLVNGVLLACIFSLFFFPLTRSKALRQMTRIGSVVVSLLITAVLIKVKSSWNIFEVLGKSIIQPTYVLIGLSAWWASGRVDYWYETNAVAKPEPLAS